MVRQANETDTDPNPFLDYHLRSRSLMNPARPVTGCRATLPPTATPRNTSASDGNKWRAHVSPDKPGRWNYTVSS